MDKNHHNKKHNNWNKQKNINKEQNSNNRNAGNAQDVKQKKFEFNAAAYDDEDVRKEKQKAIAEIKSREIICPKCNQPITDVASAMADKTTGAPVHFECVLGEIEKSETLGLNEKIAYIGQGRFGILYYENPREQRHFTIKKIIEWEPRDTQSQWRGELSNLYSKIN